MKTTIELDEAKLTKVMKLTGLKTKKEAINYALSEAEKASKINKLFETPFYVDTKNKIIDVKYDLAALRGKEKTRIKKS